MPLAASHTRRRYGMCWQERRTFKVNNPNTFAYRPFNPLTDTPKQSFVEEYEIVQADPVPWSPCGR